MISLMLRALLCLALAVLPAQAQVSQIASGTVLGNSSASRAPAAPATITGLIDRAICGTQGSVLTRNGSAWVCLAPGTAGAPLLSGGAGANIAYSSSITINGGVISGLSAPVVATDAATKGYVDGLASGLSVKTAVRLATAAVLPNTPTYANGALGVGATLTAGSNTTLTVDSTSVALNDRVLVKNQAAPEQNGPYTLTTLGSGAAAWVLTRATDFDQAAEMLAGSYFLATAGSTNANSSYVLAATVATVGTTAATFNLFSGAGVISLGGVTGVLTVGNGLAMSGSALGTTYTATGTGGAAQTIPARLTRQIYPQDYGAVCDGATNDATALQNWLNAAVANNFEAVLVGDCKTNTGLTISGSMTLRGSGPSQSLITTFSKGARISCATGIHCITIDTDHPVRIYNIAISAVAASLFDGIRVTSTSGLTLNVQTIIRDVYMQNFASCIHFVRASNFVVDGSVIAGCTTAAINAEDQFNIDTGDSIISNNAISQSSGTGILYQSGGGLKIINNKLNGTTSYYAIYLLLTNSLGAGSGGLNISANNIEGFGTAVVLARAGAGVLYTAADIIGNKLVAVDSACVFIPTDASGTWITDVNISANTCVMAGTTAIGVSADSVSGLLISANNYIGLAASNQMHAIGAGTANVTLGINNGRGAFVASTLRLGNVLANCTAYGGAPVTCY